MTKECIENFNTNFSKGGKFEIFARSSHSEKIVWYCIYRRY